MHATYKGSLVEVVRKSTKTSRIKLSDNTQLSVPTEELTFEKEEAPPAPVVEAPPAPVVEAPPAPVVEAPPAPVLEAPPAPVLEAPPAPVRVNKKLAHLVNMPETPSLRDLRRTLRVRG